MSDQAIEQSPQSRFETKLGDIKEEAVQEPNQEEPQKEE